MEDFLKKLLIFTKSENHIDGINTLKEMLLFENQTNRYDYIYFFNLKINIDFDITTPIPELKDVVRLAILAVVFCDEIYNKIKEIDITEERINYLLLFFSDIENIDISSYNLQATLSTIYSNYTFDYTKDFSYNDFLIKNVNKLHIEMFNRPFFIDIKSYYMNDKKHFYELYDIFKSHLKTKLFRLINYKELYTPIGNALLIENFKKLASSYDIITEEFCEEYCNTILNEELNFLNNNWNKIKYKDKILVSYIIIGNKATNFTVGKLIDGIFGNSKIRKIYAGFNLWNTKTSPHGNLIIEKLRFFRHDMTHFKIIFNILLYQDTLASFFDRLYFFVSSNKNILLYNFTCFIIWCYVFEGIKMETFKQKLNENFGRKDLNDKDIEWNYKYIIKHSYDITYDKYEDYILCLQKEHINRNICVFNLLYNDYIIKFKENNLLLLNYFTKEELVEFEEFMGV